MPFVKLDCDIVNSTIWFDLILRNVFLTCLLMAEPREFSGPVKQICVDSLEFTGWEAPPGWYGFVPASGPGIAHQAHVDRAKGIEALRSLGEPEADSRSSEYEGRRVIRCNGGYLILNYQKYREKDYTCAERSKRYREHKASRRSVTGERRDVTQAEAEAEAEVEVEVQKQKPILCEVVHETSIPKPPTQPDTEFVYSAYPRKIAKGDAIKAIEAACKRLQSGQMDGREMTRGDALKFLEARCKQFGLSPAGKRGTYTPHPATWFNRGSYLDDEQEWWKEESNGNGKGTSAAGQRVQRIKQTAARAADMLANKAGLVRGDDAGDDRRRADAVGGSTLRLSK